MQFDKIFEEYQGLVHSIVKNYTNDVDECSQEVFIRIWRYLETIEDERKIFYWIYSIARNTAINYGRSQSIRPLSKAEEIPEELESTIELEEWWSDVERALDDQDPLLRDVMLLKLKGYSQKEVSGKLQISRKQFYDLHAEGKKYLAKTLLSI